MAETKKIMTPEEKKKHLHDIIKQWKKDTTEAQEALDKKCETPEFKAVLKKLKEANAKRGIIIPGEI